VGYGDFYPRTTFGRTVIVICCVYGVWVFSLVVVTITNTHELSKVEQKAFLVIRRLMVVDKMKAAASHVVSSVGNMRGLETMGRRRKSKLYNNLIHHSSDFGDLVR